MGRHLAFAAVSLELACAAVMSAQSAPSTVNVTAVPRLIRVSGSFHPAGDRPVAGVEGVILAIYREETGGAPLWQETQNVTVETDGRYTVTMGSTSKEGIPLELFLAGEPRWLGVQFNRPGETEQPRVLLASVPYALKALDAETLGGKPASAYALAGSAPSDTSPAAGTTAAGKTALASVPRANSGIVNYVGKFINGVDLVNSALYDKGGSVGLNTNNPWDAFHVSFLNTSGTMTGYAVQNLGSSATSYSGMLFYDQLGNLGQFQGFNNSTHEYRINNIASSGSINFMLGSVSKFQVRSDGDVNIAGAIRKSGAVFLHDKGSFATAVGINALAANAGAYSTAAGYEALTANTSGNWNVAMGLWAARLNTTGSSNIAIGGDSLYANTTGASNTAVGDYAMGANVSGSQNIALGASAGGNIVLSNNIMIGHDGQGTDSGVIRVGKAGYQTKAFIAGIRGVTTGTGDAVAVFIDSAGQLGTASSSRRFKEDIHDMGDASRNVMRLRPVTFHYRRPYADGTQPVQYGLIAEEVAEVYPDLVARSADGQIETVKYHILPTLLLNEVQRQQAGMERQHAELGTHTDQIQALEKRMAEQREENLLLRERLARLEAALAAVPTSGLTRR